MLENKNKIKHNTLYKKANSFVELSGTSVHKELFDKLRRISKNRHLIPKNFRSVVGQACDDILNPKNSKSKKFKLLPFVNEELARINDNDIYRYLYYRYRYEVYPEIKHLDNYPPCVQIEPTSICNYRCVFCYQTDRRLTQGKNGHMGMMDINLFKNIIDQIEGKVEAVTLASRGEPLMAQYISEMLNYLPGKFLGLKINTNASFLTEEKAHAILGAQPNTLVFSADASDKELYSKLRVNGNLDTVIRNIERFNEIRTKQYPKSNIITRVSGVRFTKEQKFSKIESFWDQFVDQVAFVEYNPWESAYDSPPNNIKKYCSDLWRRTFIWWDGTVNPCDVDYRSTLAVGNINNERLENIWLGENYSKLRDTHSNNKRCSLSPCSGCKLV